MIKSNEIGFFYVLLVFNIKVSVRYDRMDSKVLRKEKVNKLKSKFLKPVHFTDVLRDSKVLRKMVHFPRYIENHGVVPEIDETDRSTCQPTITECRRERNSLDGSRFDLGGLGLPTRHRGVG